MIKKLYAMILRSTPYPPFKKVSSCEGEWTSIMSASPLCACAIAAPVPRATKLTVIHGYFASKAAFMLLVPLSSIPVSWRLVVVATVNVVGLGVGVGAGVGVGVGVSVGVAVAARVGVGVGGAVGVGVKVGVEVGVGVVIGVEVGGAVVGV